ncbi:hypothetical protein K3495_g2181 [Podosphaera aphanis]|nr:hypothetical protein K3495_g2181 [Podosphaera aphanis]
MAINVNFQASPRLPDKWQQEKFRRTQAEDRERRLSLNVAKLQNMFKDVGREKKLQKIRKGS